MNVYDSDQMMAGLRALNYKPALSMDTADLIVLNTCAVREKAEQKAYSFLGRLAKLKKKKPGLLIGVGGCVAQQAGERILARMPHLDFVFGTHAIGRLPDIINQITSKKCRMVDTDMSPEIEEIKPAIAADTAGGPGRYVTVMRGCDNYCSYCVVPFVRGGETSRDPDRIIADIRRLVAGGVREVTLLGQNVNSYGRKEGLCTFPQLLEKINEIDGLLRIRFTTSHPRDLSDALIELFGTLDKLCNHIHLPVQSGSNRILERMNRCYTREAYLEKIAKLRAGRPDIAITSDFIVGFPGETDRDFEATLDLIQQVNYDGLFAFMYSDRPQAPSARMASKVPAATRRKRLQRLLDVQQTITRRKNQALVGRSVEILVDGMSIKVDEHDTDAERRQAQWSGRTSTNRIVHFDATDDAVAEAEDYTGHLVHVKIEKAFDHSLWGQPVGSSPSAKKKGETCYAA